jgi:hypothetical protein
VRSNGQVWCLGSDGLLEVCVCVRSRSSDVAIRKESASKVMHNNNNDAGSSLDGAIFAGGWRIEKESLPTCTAEQQHASL